MAKIDFTALYSQMIDLTAKEENFSPSGSIILDAVISNGRGIPEGTFIEIASESGCGKSTMCLHITKKYCSQGRRVIYIDTESGLNGNQIDCFGLRQYVEEMLFIPVRLQTYGEVDNFLMQVLEDKEVALIIYDSITATVPGKLTEKNVDEMNEPGVAARIQSNFMQKFKSRFKNSNKTVIFVNQLRTKIAMGYGQVTKLTQAGGQALGYYMDVRIMMKKVKMLEQTLPGYEKPVPYGCDLAIWTDKNRYARPLLKKVITVHFGKGISNAGAIRSVLEYHGVVERVPRKGYRVKYQNEDIYVKVDEVEGFIKDHLKYFAEVADGLGGIALIPNEEDEVVDSESELSTDATYDPDEVSEEDE
jgi:RecA/RadA recombinase